MTLSCCGLATKGDGYSNRSGSLSSSQYWLSCCFCWCAIWLNNRVTEQRADCHAVAFFLFVFFFLFPSAGAKLYGRPAEVTAAAKCAMRIELADQTAPPYIGLSCVKGSALVGAAEQSCACAAHCSSQSSRITQRRGEKRERDSTGGDETEGGRAEREDRAAGEVLWFYLHLQPSSHK